MSVDIRINPELAEKLDENGWTLSVERDDSINYPYLDEFGAPFQIERYKKNGGGENTTLEYDLDSPYSLSDGFSRKSLFLYLNDMERIRDFLENCEYRPSCEEARDIRDFLAGMKKELDNLPDGEDMEPIADGILEKLDDYRLEDAYDIDYWLTDMLSGTGYLEDTSFVGNDDDELNGYCLGTTPLLDLRISIENGDANFPECLDKAVAKLTEFVNLHERTCGGELEQAELIKKGYAHRYGASEPAAFCGIDLNGGEGCGAMIDQECEPCDEVFVLHARDAQNVDNPRKTLENLARDHVSTLNAGYWQWILRDRDGEIVDSCGGYCLRDLDNLQMDVEEKVNDALSDVQRVRM